MQPGVARAVDGAHTARTEGGHNFVRAEAGTGANRHLRAEL
jgi:hypothetical protein